MGSDDEDTPRARQERADAIRRERDARIAGRRGPAEPAEGAPPGDEAAPEADAEAEPPGEPQPPNYVDWIDRKMRESTDE